MPEYGARLSLLKKMPRIWTENLLVADDSFATTTLLADTLSGEGSVYTAENGLAAMARLNANYFAAIVSDVSMPLMSGVEFYEAAEKTFPGIGRRFIFFSDTASIRDVEFFRTNKVNYLQKPASIADVRKTVLKVMGQR